jgi:S1-C subfamily serine protease
MKNLKNIFKNHIVTAVVVSAVVSAVVGGVFGYYGATFFNQGTAPLLQHLTGAKSDTYQPVTDEESKVVSAVKRASPAVVSIVATKDVAIVEQQNPFQEFCNDPFFRQFLGNQCNTPSQPPKTQTQQVAAGSGFIINSNGLILTNKHVVNISGASYTVITNDGKKYSAQVLARDPVQDLAVVKINASGLPALTVGDSANLQIGQTVIAIGNALGQFSNSVSKGVISGLSRSITASEGSGSSETLSQVIQTDAAINPGNSGGPLLNLAGQVIGVNTAIVQGAQNIGFAIPIDQAKRDISQVETTGKISYPYLGIRYVLVTDDIKQKNNLSVNYGALVIRGSGQGEVAVAPSSPADKAGIKEGDVVLEIDGKKIDQNNDLAKATQSHNVGDTVMLKVLSGGQEKTVQVTLVERPL